ncbi:MAG: peptidase, partial [Flavobacteriales bacterium]|nr:peptidase [Flavobacteriales bacterium]
MSLLLLGGPAVGQTFWSEAPTSLAERQSGERRITPVSARIVDLNISAMRSFLQQIAEGSLTDIRSSGAMIQLPDADDGIMRFRVLGTSIMEAPLQAMFPGIRTFTGVGVDDPGAILKMDVTPHGFHAMVLATDGDDLFIDPMYAGNDARYQIYRKSAFTKQLLAGFQLCSYDQVNDIAEAQRQTRSWMAQRANARVGDCQLRTYRLALACTGEYANYHGSNTGNNDKSFAVAAMATTMNRVNGIYERDATLTMVLVAGNDQLIFLDGATDPYTNGSGTTMLGENTTTCNSVIGSANYDIGHVFSTGGGGVASLNSPCTSNKARGVTGQANPVGDPFDIDYVAHEMGHQYGGNHTQNNNCNRASVAAVEVGSGITIMGYAGICAPDVANNSIAMFGGYSMQEISANITSGNSSTCPTTTPLVNQAPVADAGPNRTIPAATPFLLAGSATDADAGDLLTYSWEQMDNAVATQPPSPSNTDGPAWEPLLPKNTPQRYMPRMDAVVANTTPTWEVLSSVSRTYDFRFTVRDNVPGGGCHDQDDMVVTVDGNSGPFLVTQPNTAVSWDALSTRNITWDVAGTNGGAVSCANVDILLSLDGGFTYPVTLATATANDGSEAVVIPNQVTSTARIMVRANGNIFYDISDTDFSITAPTTPDYSLTVPVNAASVCQPTSAQYTIQVGSILGYSSAVTLSV